MSSTSPTTLPPPLPEPCMVYLDTCALVDLADITRTRYTAAVQLLSLFQKYQNSGLLWLTTSLWAITECHSVLYGMELERKGTPVPRRGGKRRKLRDTVPPDQAGLTVATQQKDALIYNLSTTTDFTLLPDPNRDASAILQLTMRLAQEAGIWAPDSIHVSIALESKDCSIFVTDDGDLLDKLDSCQPHLIQPYRRQQFSMLSTPLPFDSYGVEESTSELPSPPRRTRQSALQALNALGFL